MSDGGAAADPAARAFVVAARPELGGGTVATPSALLMTPAGEVVGEIDPYLAPEEFLEHLLEVLRREPEFSRASARELALTDPFERAQLAFDLHDLTGAKRLLETAQGPSARYLAGHIARLEGDFERMEAEFARVNSPAFADDLMVERAQRDWKKRDFAALAESTLGLSPSSERLTEALYLRGLALYHLGSREEALAQWMECAQHAQDAWVYRSDWAYSEVKGGKVLGGISTVSTRNSPLGRIGYIGRSNPDLVPH